MKQIKRVLFVFLLAFLTVEFGFAADSTTTLKTGALSGSAAAKLSIISSLDSLYKTVNGNIGSFNTKYNADFEFSILSSLNVLSGSHNLTGDFLTAYFVAKQEVLLDFDQVSAKILLLEEKCNLKLLTSDSCSTEFAKINSDVKALETKHKSNIVALSDQYNIKISNIEKDFLAKKTQYSSTITKIKTNIEKFNTLDKKFKNFNELVDKINILYVNKYDTIQVFINELNQKTSQLLRVALIKNYDVSLSNYEKLTYYDKDINNYIQTLVDSYNLLLTNTFQDLIKGFYTQEEYDFVSQNYADFKKSFLSGSSIIYNNLSGSLLDTYNNRLNTKLDSIINNINSKLTNVNNSSTIESLRDTLNNKIQTFYSLQLVENTKLLNTYVSQKKELLGYKLSSDLKEYGSFVNDIKIINEFTGTNKEKYEKIVQIQKFYKSKLAGIIDVKTKKDFYYAYRSLEIKKIDLFILVNGLTSYNLKYKNSLDVVLKVLDANTKKYTNIDLQEKFYNKLDTVNDKIDALLNSSSNSKEKQYLLLIIKKAIITFKYLKQ